MEEILNYIKNNNDMYKRIRIICILLFNTIYNKYPTANAIALIDILYKNTYNTNIDIFNYVNYVNIMARIKSSNNNALYDYFILLHDHYKIKNNINNTIKLLNKYKFNTYDDITIETLQLYISTILNPYIKSNFDDRFIESIKRQLNSEEWKEIHKNEIINRLTNVMQLFNKNICKMCDIKVPHINTIINMSFDELIEYFISCGNKMTTKIDSLSCSVDLYEIMDDHLTRMIEHNANYINNENINQIIFDNL